jgi:hypothetical protein
LKKDKQHKGQKKQDKLTTIYKTLQIKRRESTIEEGQATQWPKVTGQIDKDLQNITDKTLWILLVLSLMFRRLLSICPVTFGHCVVCPSSICGFS